MLPVQGTGREAREEGWALGGEATPAAPKAPADPFAFGMSAFGGTLDKPPPQAPPADPFVFDMAAFGGSGAPETPAAPDPYAFDPSVFGAGPPAPAQGPADPCAFDPSAFEAAGQPQTAQSQSSGADPYAFSMDAFGGEPPRKPSSKDADPFAFDMSAFEGPQPPKAPTSEASKTPAQLGNPSGASQPLKTPQPTPAGFPKPPKADFRPLTPSEVAKLEAGLIPPPLEPRSESEEETCEPTRYGVFGCGQESAAVAGAVVELSHCVALGRPGSIADASGLDSAAQLCAASIQVSIFSLSKHVVGR